MIRIRIVRGPPIESLDGVQLDRFEVGEEYELGNSTASLLLAEGWAEPVPLDSPRPFRLFGEDDPYITRVLRPNLRKERYPPLLQRDLAADYRWRRRKRR